MNPTEYIFVPEKGKVKIAADLNVRKGKPSRDAELSGILLAGTMAAYLGYVKNGDKVGENAKWFLSPEGDFFWSGSTAQSGGPTIGKVLRKPLDELICTQRFGERPEIYAQFGMKGHNGTDFRTRKPEKPNEWKKPVYSVLDGKVTEATEGPSNGKYLRIAHDNGYESVYLHLSQIDVKKNQRVAAGAKIAVSGNSGQASEAPHLHFGFRPQKFDEANGFKGYIDPLPFFIDEVKFV